MKKRVIGYNGPLVSEIVLGCMGMSWLYGKADRSESIATIHAAHERGITLFDTGDFYGDGYNYFYVKHSKESNGKMRLFQ